MKTKNYRLLLLTIFLVHFNMTGIGQTISDFIIKRDPEKNIGKLYKIKGKYDEITKTAVLTMGDDRDCYECDDFLRNFSMALDTLRMKEFLTADFIKFENDTIDYIFEVNNLIISPEYIEETRTDPSNSATKRYSGYGSQLFFDVNLKNIDGDIIRSTKTKVNPNSFQIRSTPEEANRVIVFEAERWSYKLNDSIVKLLPPSSIILKADEYNKNNEATIITIEGGEDIGVTLKKDLTNGHFNVYDGLSTSDKLIGDLKIKSVDATSTKCKVVSGGDLIAKSLKEGKKLLVVEKME